MSDLLFLAHRIPYPPNKGDKLRSYHLLKHLSQRFRVHLGAFVDDSEDWQHVGAVKAMCAETYFASLNPVLARFRSLASFASGESLTVGYYRDASLARWVNLIVKQYSIKRVLTFSSAMAQYVTHDSITRRVADMVDVDSAKWRQYALDKQWPLSWIYRRESRTLLDFERRVAETFDASVFVTEAEARLFRGLTELSSERIFHSSNGVDTEYFSPSVEHPSPYGNAERILVFTGAMDYWPNVDAVLWFATTVFPLIQRTWADVQFFIVGARPTAEVVRLGELAGVTVTGTVPDVRPYIAHASAVVAPLKIARGIQNKVLEGMAMGRTVIASPNAAEGIDAEPERDFVVASTPADYLAAARRVFEGSCDLGQSARAKILGSYSWDQNLSKMALLLDGLNEHHEPATLRFSAATRG